MNALIRLSASAIVLWSLASTARADLPDFTQLVEKNSVAVVNITARKTTDSDDNAAATDDQDIPEMFKRFFGPNGPHNFRSPQQPPRDRVSGGSGFIISTDGYILTNHHVVKGADEVTVRFKDRHEKKARVIGSDSQSDVALLKVEETGLPAVKTGDTELLKPGQWVVAIGSPFNLDYTVTAGVVSAKGRSLSDDQRYVPFIQTDVAINPGNSGGPLFNLNGEVVGINSQIFSNSGGYLGVSFAIPIEVATKVAEQLKKSGHVSRGSLGVQIQEVDAARAEALGLAKPRGALVVTVLPGSAAEKAGLKPSDVILAFNGTEVGRSQELPPLVGAVPPGGRATLTVSRDGKEISVPVVVDELKDPTASTKGKAAGGNPASSDGLGLAVRDLTDEEREEAGLKGEGVLITDISGKAARRAGLAEGDVVLMVGRNKITKAADFRAAAAQVKPGQAVMLLVRRGETSTFIPLKLDEK